MVIDRAALVARHQVRLTQPDPMSPLSVGNGEFAFTADITGLQTFPEFHAQGLAIDPDLGQDKPVGPPNSGIQTGSQSQWGWHYMPNPHGFKLEDVLSDYPTARGNVSYPDKNNLWTTQTKSQAEQDPGTWLYNNPQRLDLGRVGLDLQHGEPDRPPVQMSDLTSTEQTLDLWQGLLSSSFTFEGAKVKVLTVAHPTLDLIAVRIESPLLGTGPLAVKVAFPYAAITGISAGSGDWTVPERHQTEYTGAATGTGGTFTRTLDATRYYAALEWNSNSENTAASISQIGPHQYRLALAEPAPGAEPTLTRIDRPGVEFLELTMAFAPAPISAALPSFEDTRAAAAKHWAEFWQNGGAVDLSGSSDPRAHELERRIVLSQYLTAINCAGTTPPQENGLVCNSWNGKFHLEMHWWHAAHFTLWGRPQLLEKSLPWYHQILPVAQATARRQGYRGCRWPKEIGPDARESPNTIGPFLIWQQPHPIYYAELLWRAHPDRETLERYQEIVFETAEFMAAFPELDSETRRYNLAPPLVPAQESYFNERVKVINPTFELAYWYWGLETAQKWRERLGLERDPEWERVKNGLAAPAPRDGIYPAIQSEPYTIRNDHPSMLMALGFVPQTPLINPDIMRQTLKSIQEDWDWPSSWGWDYPVLAMCAARLGDRSGAVDGLLMPVPKNTHLPNGHNLQIPLILPLYLPGNGGLLAAVALMAAGWEGGPDQPAPGFPDDGSWVVRAEGLTPSP